MSTQFEYFAACAPGLEPLLRAELARLGLAATVTPGGVTGRSAWPGLWNLHLKSGLAESVRLRMKSFEAHSFAALEEGLARLPWHAFLWRGQPLDLRVTCEKSKLYHSDAVAERLERVIGERLAKGRKHEGSLAPARVHLRLVRDRVTPSIDCSGERMHRRGYRTDVEAAPLRETLAAAMVELLESLAAGRGHPIGELWDPFCGSGVLPLEWLRRAHGVLPGAERTFAFEAWPTHDQAAYEAHKRAALDAARVASAARAYGSDIDPKAIQSARNNAERSGLAAYATFTAADYAKALTEIPSGAAVLSNPPYGKRIGSADRSRKLFTSLARAIATRKDLGPVVLACPDPRWLPERDGWKALVKTSHGGVPLSFVGLSRL